MGWETRKINCGCELRVFVEDGKITKIDLQEEVPLDCPKVWELIKSGNTWGIFQLEKGLGQGYSKKYKPENIEDLACLLAIIRPGCLDAKIDDKTVTKHICDRRSGKEEVTYLHPELKDITKDTNGFLVFQEQCIQLVQDLAGFTGEEGDALRKCLSAETLLVTEEWGPLTIKEISEMDPKELPKIISCDTNGKKAIVELDSVWKSGNKKVFELTTRNGISLKASEDHEFLTDNGFIKLKDLSVGNFVCCSNELGYEGTQSNISAELSELLGYFISEGYRSNNGSVCSLVNSDKWMLDRIKNIIDSNFGPNNYSQSKEKENGCIELTFKGDFRKWLVSVVSPGLSADKEIPKPIIASGTKDLSVLSSFIAAAWSGDGTVNESSDYLSYCTISKRLSMQLQSSLLSMGIKSTRYKTQRKGRNTEYYVNICNIESIKVFDDITNGKLCPTKSNKVRNILTKNRYYFASNEIIPSSIMKKLTEGVNLSQLLGTKNNGTYTRNMTYEKAERFNEKLKSQDLEKTLNMHYKYVAISSIKEVGFEDVYDFTVSHDSIHWAYANGLVVHNCIGKKIPELMAEMKDKFMKGCDENPNVSQEEAEKIFAGIEASQRYSFNKSHSVGYALNSYIFSAYVKAHFPRAFYMSKLKFAKDNEKIAETITDALKLGVTIRTPSLKHFNKDPKIDRADILFPLNQIKAVSDDHIDQIKKNVGDRLDMPWQQWLFQGFEGVNKTACTNLIKCGAMDFLGVPRAKMLAYFNAFRGVTNKPLREAIARDYYEDPIEGIRRECEVGFGKDKVFKTTRSIEGAKKFINLFQFADEGSDSIKVIAAWEKSILGREMTFTELEDSKLGPDCITCADWNEGRGLSKEMKLPVILNRVSEYETDKGKLMGFLEGYDITGNCSDIVVFSNIWQENMALLYEGNKVLLKGAVKDQSFEVRGVEQL